MFKPKRKKIGYGPLKNSGERSRANLALLFISFLLHRPATYTCIGYQILYVASYSRSLLAFEL